MECRTKVVVRTGSLAEEPGKVVYRAWVNCDDAGVPFQCSFEDCENRVWVDCWYCDRHLKEVCGVEVKQSKIKGAGKGVFACRTFRKGDEVAHYGGEVISPEEMEARWGAVKQADGEWLQMTAPYAIGIDDSDNVKDAVRIRGAGSYANDGKISGMKPNCDLYDDWLVAKRRIKPGEEILVDYGTEYWSCAGPEYMSVVNQPVCQRVEYREEDRDRKRLRLE